MRYTLYISILCFACLSCDSGVEGNPLGIKSTSEGISVHNLSNKTLYYTAFERERLAYINWAPCTRPLDCDHVTPGAATVILYDSIYGYEPGKEVVVFWWNLEKSDNSEYKAMNLTNAIVKP